MLFHNLERRCRNTLKHIYLYTVYLPISWFGYLGFVGTELDSRDGKHRNSIQLCCSSCSGHKYQGCCTSVVSLTETYPKLTICININRTTKPVENFGGAFGSLHYGTSYAEKAACGVVCEQLCSVGVIFLLWKITNIVSYSLYFCNYLRKRKNRGKYTECTL